jgi:hypothetical protein
MHLVSRMIATWVGSVWAAQSAKQVVKDIESNWRSTVAVKTKLLILWKPRKSGMQNLVKF